MHKKRSLTKWQSGFIFALVGTFLFSSKGIFIKLAYVYSVDTITLLTLRMLIALPFYLGLLWWSWQKMKTSERVVALERGRLPKIAILGIMGYYIASFLDLEALHYISIQLERLVLLTYPMFVVVISAILFRERLKGNLYLALLLSYSGIAILFGHDLSYDLSVQDNVLKGGLFVVAAAFSFAFYFTLAKGQISVVGSIFFTCIAMISATIAICIHFLIAHVATDLFVHEQVLWLAVILAIFCTVLPSFFMTEAIGRIGSVSSAMIGSAGPFFTAIMAVFILGEAFTIFHIIGMGLTMSGLYILGRKKA